MADKNKKAPPKAKPKKAEPKPKKPEPPKKVSLQIQQLKSITEDELKSIYQLVLNNSMATLGEYVKAGFATALEAMVISVVQRIVESGDMRQYDAFLDRLGIMKTEAPVGAPVDGGTGIVAKNVSVNVYIPSNGREAKNQKTS